MNCEKVPVKEESSGVALRKELMPHSRCTSVRTQLQLEQTGKQGLAL